MLEYREIPAQLPSTLKAVLTVAQYPCQRCVFKKLSTIDQFSAFFNLRLTQTYVALCWKARFEGADDPIYFDVKQGRISQDFYDLVWLEVSYLESLWGLCQLVAPLMLDGLHQRGGEELVDRFSSLFLFRAAVMESANQQIELSFGYVEVSSRAVDTAFKLKAKGLRDGLTPREAKRLRDLTIRLPLINSEALNLIIAMVATSFRNKAVRGQFEMLVTATANLWEKKATVARKQGSWGWNHGVKLKGSSNSTYSPVHSDS